VAVWKPALVYIGINQRPNHLSDRRRVEDGEERNLRAERVPETIKD